MASIINRPLDLLIVVCLFFFLLIALTIDFTQAFYGDVVSLKDGGGVWPPSLVVEYYAWWSENYDPLLSKNPSWYETMSWFSPLLYAPFYVCAIYAFIFEKNWIRIPALMWGYGLILTMVVVVREELYGEYATPNPAMFLAAYGSYVAVPIIVMLRVASDPVFGKQKLS